MKLITLKHSLISLLLLLSSVAFSQDRDTEKVVWVERNGISVPLPPIEHPRLFVREWEIPALKDSLSDNKHKSRTVLRSTV